MSDQKTIIEQATQAAYDAVNRLANLMIYYQPIKFLHTDTVAPMNGQACWVRHRNGAEYRMTYPFSHKDYPLWYPLPKE